MPSEAKDTHAYNEPMNLSDKKQSELTSFLFSIFLSFLKRCSLQSTLIKIKNQSPAKSEFLYIP